MKPQHTKFIFIYIKVASDEERDNETFATQTDDLCVEL